MTKKGAKFTQEHKDNMSKAIREAIKKKKQLENKLITVVKPINTFSEQEKAKIIIALINNYNADVGVPYTNEYLISKIISLK